MQGAIVMLLRNLSVFAGQCNGTRMRVTDIHPNVSPHLRQEYILTRKLQLLTCEIITEGAHKGTTVFIPRVYQEPSEQIDPQQFFKRLQFPVRLAYAMTINKSQGQSLDKVR